MKSVQRIETGRKCPSVASKKQYTARKVPPVETLFLFTIGPP